MPISPSVLLEPTLSAAGPVFAMTAANDSGFAVLSVCGELDQRTNDQFEQALATVLYDQPPVLVVDLTDTTFLGTCAMGALLRLHRRMQDARGDVVVVACGPATARPLHLLGLSETIAIVDSIDIALRRNPAVQPPDPAPSSIGGRG
jgi:anti-sigma B factor antagonist